MKQRRNTHMEQIVEFYYKNQSQKLRNLVDEILQKLQFNDVEKSDFYSLANEVFVTEVLENYEEGRNFDHFLYSCLYKKFCSEMTKMRRDKRCAKIKVKVKDANGQESIQTQIIPDICIDRPLKEGEDYTLGDLIADEFDIYKEAFGEKEESYSKKMILYLSRLSSLQKEVLRLRIAGYMPKEIKKELQMTKKQYKECQSAIHSYRNISILF